MADILKAEKAAYDEAIKWLKAGEPVAMPTETVYGLAGLASNDDAVANIYRIKNRPTSKPFSVVVSSVSAAAQIADINSIAKTLMDAFWPGPLTLVLPLKANAKFSALALAGGKTIGLRCPDIPWMAYFAKTGFDAPLVLPSANTSGEPAPTTASGVNADLGDKISVIIDGGNCKTGTESTILSIENDRVRVLRMGAVPPEALAPYSIDWDIR